MVRGAGLARIGTFLEPRLGRVSQRLLGVWIAMLLLAEADDVYTTAADLKRGGIEGNQLAAEILNLGGPQLLALVDFCIVLTIAVIALLAVRLRDKRPTLSSRLLVELVYRGIQMGVLLRLVNATANLVILTRLT